MATPLVTRFAPSPTGHLHLGNARTALLNFLAARKSGGRFILRVDDSDEANSSESFMEDLLTDLRWLGLEWDEGPDIGGPHANYRQQHRRAIYEEWLAKLDAADLIYPCFCTPSELNVSRRQQLAAGKTPRYSGTCRVLTEAQRCERLVRGQPAALRFKVAGGKMLSFVDLVHGEQRILSDDVGDFILRRADGGTAIFFSNAIDDALMNVTLVLRGEDHLANTPRQLLILDALKLPAPQYAHVALLLGLEGVPLSKRHGAFTLQDLRRRGFLADAIRNYLVRLGHRCQIDCWLDDKSMIAQFDLARLEKAPARFDDAQLRHWQREAVTQLPDAALLAWASEHLPSGLTPAHRELFAKVVRGSVEIRSDTKIWADIIFGTIQSYSDDAKAAMREATPSFFETAAEAFAVGSDFNEVVCDIARRIHRRESSLSVPLRAALTGVTQGPELAPLVALLPREQIRSRLVAAQRIAE